MEKTKFGLSTALLGAIIYFACYFGGVTATLLIVGTILLVEENAQIKKIAITAATLVFAFAVLSSLIYLLPNFISCINNILAYFSTSFEITIISKLANTLNTVLDFLEKIIFLALGLCTLTNKNVTVKAIDDFVDKHIIK